MAIESRSFNDFLNKVGFTATDYQDGVSWVEAKGKNSALSERDHDSFERLAAIAGDRNQIDAADQKLLYSNPTVVTRLISEEYITTAFENSPTLDIHYGGQGMKSGPYNENVPLTEHRRYVTYVQFLLGHILPDTNIIPDGGYGRQMSEAVQGFESILPGLSKKDMDGDTINRNTLHSLVFYGNRAQNQLQEVDTLIARLEKKRDYFQSSGSGFEYFDESKKEAISSEMNGDSALAYALQYLGYLDGMTSVNTNPFLTQKVGEILQDDFDGKGSATYNAAILKQVIDELKELRGTFA